MVFPSPHTPVGSPPPAQFPEKLRALFEPRRYKVLYGGRGAGRSWGVARALLMLGRERALRVLCAREFQNSITESVHKLLSDQIAALGLEGHYEIQQARIIGLNGTTFSFEGIKNNVLKIKSYEAIDIAWVEEANKVSKGSWMVLLPTIRKEGSEIWMTFNPELEEDYTYQRFVKGADAERSHVIHMTYRDNPWFPQVLEDERKDLETRDPDAYLNVWEGKCVQVLEGAIYAKELRKVVLDGRVCRVPWHSETPVDVFWDLGHRDNTSMWFGQRVAMQLRVLRAFEDRQQKLSYFVKELQRLPYVYGTMYLPHDAQAERLGTKHTIEEQLKMAGFRVQIVPKIGKIDGINAAREMLAECWFDETETTDGLHALRNYKYKVVDGRFSAEPLHDWASDFADAFRYMAVAQRGPKTPGDKVKKALERSAMMAKRGLEHAGLIGPQGWMRH